VLDLTQRSTPPSRDDDEHPRRAAPLIGQDTVGFGTKDGALSFYGAPYFNGWPQSSSTTHQQVYYSWLERAWRGGLRLMVMLAVTNEALCGSNDGTDCANSMGPINEQLAAALDFESFIDGLSGGPGTGWFRIVRTPAEARTAIRSGKLAVVLGIEVDNLFNCKETGCAPPFDLHAAVSAIYDKGVRHVFPVHNFDNAFGAAATWQDAIGVGQAYPSGAGGRRGLRRPEVMTTGSGSRSRARADPRSTRLRRQRPRSAAGVHERRPLPTTPAATPAAFARPRTAGTAIWACASLDELMDRGMIIDIDHMSNHTSTTRLRSQPSGIQPLPIRSWRATCSSSICTNASSTTTRAATSACAPRRSSPRSKRAAAWSRRC
jgi:hypothetical protein